MNCYSPNTIIRKDNKIKNNLKNTSIINNSNIYSINKSKTMHFSSAFSNINNIERNLTSNLAFILEIIKEREKLLCNIIQPNGNRHESTKQYYLISKNYMSEINSIFHINDIYSIIQKNQRLNESEKINFIKENLAENKKIELDCLNKENIISLILIIFISNENIN